MQKLSIIVPVYNTKEQLERCLTSLELQTDMNIEIIIINDGSTDESEKIILEHVKQYPTLFHYYKKENTGLADTRNFGIQKATGDYLLFVDSDDYIAEDLVQKLRIYMEQDIEVIKFKMSVVNNNETRIIDGPVFNQIDGETAFNLLVYDDIVFDSACIYLFKKDLFLQGKFTFPVGTYHEDFGIVPLMLLTAKTMVSTSVNGYFYVQTDDSIMRNQDYQKTLKKFQDSLLHYDNMIMYIKSLNLNKKTKRNIKIFYTNSILLKLEPIKKEDRKEYIKQIKQRKLVKNIKPYCIKQLIKRILLSINIDWYFKLRK